MGDIHRVSSENINFRYHQPKSKENELPKGVMYEKFDAKTKELKLKSGGNWITQLLMKARGYSEMKENTARTFLKSKFTDSGVDDRICLADVKRFAGKGTLVVRTEVFQSNFNALESRDKLVKDLKATVNGR